MPNLIEETGLGILERRLIADGRSVEKSKNKTFDLVVDGKFAEVKTKYKPYEQIDFISFTDKQYEEILNGDFVTFLVCNVKDPENVQIIEIKSSDLKKIEPKKYTSHEFNKSVLDILINKR